MTALTIERKTPKLGQDALPNFPTNIAMPLEANAKIFAGAIIAQNPAGNIVQATAAGAALGAGYALSELIIVGIAEKTADNTGGAAGALTIVPRIGVFQFNNSGGADAIAQTHFGRDCYVVDDNVVALSAGIGSGGTPSRPRAGVIWGVDTSGAGGVWVLIGLPVAGASILDAPANVGMFRQVRAVIPAALSAYTAAAGVITANANGALATQDGITLAVGDRVFLPPTIAAADADAGIYVVTNLGSAGSKFVLTLAPDWATGLVQDGITIVAGPEGTTWKDSEWRVFNTGAVTVGTTALVAYPRVVKGTQALSGGTATVSSLWVRSTTSGLSLVDQTAAAAVKGVLTAGAGSGSLALTGTTTDSILYTIINF